MEKNLKIHGVISSVSEKLKNKTTILIILIIGVIIMLSAGAFGEKSKDSEIKAEGDMYYLRLEKKLTDILTEMKGVGRVKVMIAPGGAAASEGSIFASRDAEEHEIKGVVIAAEGAFDPAVNEKIYYAAKAALNIGGSRIAVVELK